MNKLLCGVDLGGARGICYRLEDHPLHRSEMATLAHPFTPIGERVYPTIERFLEMRLSEARMVCDFLGGDHLEKMSTFVAQMSAVLEFHKNWPVLVTTKPEIRGTVPLNTNAVAYSISQQIEWLTQQEYKKKFGTEPPTAPLLRKMANYHSNHKDFNPDWKL